jgi:hypothetical protein
MTRRGLLLTMTEPPAAMEEEFNAWYDDEHMHERLAIPGFRSARRWVTDCKPGEGKYLATYELDSLSVLQSKPYLDRFNNQTPWSKRCLGKAVVFRRWALEQSGSFDPHPKARAIALITGDSPTDAFRIPDALQARHFHDPAGKPPYVALFELGEVPKTGPGRVYRAY